jgi:outer membrane protein assembly factor BamC
LVEQDGEARLIVDEEYTRAWRLVGLALDGGNYAVDEQSRGQGLYVVEYRDPLLENQQPGESGFFSRLAFWRGESKAPPPGTRYRVRLAGQGQQTVVVVRDADDRPVDSASARQVLEAVQRILQ